jgi:hypothetical protein
MLSVGCKLFLDNMSEQNAVEEESFNAEFLESVERYLDNCFGHFHDKRINSLSCDGILPPWMEKQVSRKSVNVTRQITGITVFFLGLEKSSANTVYELTIKFGKYSLRRYAKGTSLIDCIPDPDATGSITVDVENKKIVLTLR